MMPIRLDLVTLFVADPAAVGRWYAEHLGLAVLEQTERFVRLEPPHGGAHLAFHVGTPVSNPGQVQLHFDVADVDAEAERLRGEGVELVDGPEDKPWGWRVASVRDPAGHTVELVARL